MGSQICAVSCRKYIGKQRASKCILNALCRPPWKVTCHCWIITCVLLTRVVKGHLTVYCSSFVLL